MFLCFKIYHLILPLISRNDYVLYRPVPRSGVELWLRHTGERVDVASVPPAMDILLLCLVVSLHLID